MVMSQIEQDAHALLPRATHDELARQQFVRSFKEYIVSDIHPGNRQAYELRAKPSFEEAHGGAPKNWRDVASVMEEDPHFQMFSSLLRTSPFSLAHLLHRFVPLLQPGPLKKPSRMGFLCWLVL